MRMQASGVMVCCKHCYDVEILYLMCSVDSFQFHRRAPLVMSDLLMETMRWRGEWRCAEVECGEQFMTTVDGTIMMQKSHADN